MRVPPNVTHDFSLAPSERLRRKLSAASAYGFAHDGLELDRKYRNLALPDDTEILALKKVSLPEAVRMVMDSEITDSLSIAAILKVARLKGI